MQKKIFYRLMSISLVVALFMVLLTSAVLYVSFEKQLASQLKQDGVLLASLLNTEEDPLAQLSVLTFTNRVTLVGDDGSVLFDSQSSPSRMDNHSQREEIFEAARDGEGFAKRRSDTLFEEQIYYALRLENGAYLRVASSQKSIGGLMSQMLGWVVLGLIAVTLLAVILSQLLTKRLIEPINTLNFDDPLSNDVYDEFSPMLRRMAEQNQKIDAQMKELSARQEEMETLIGNMREGMLIMDGKQRVITMNKSASACLQTDRPADGKTTLAELNRSESLRSVVAAAQKQGSAQAEMTVAGREYTLRASVIGDNEGMVLLFQDRTGEKNAERSRKQFTANVSHELRTPLTTISGYAEMLDTGMAKPEDVQGFSHKIYQESQRLLSLIEDILRLSRLDEGHQHGKWESVDLLAICQKVSDNLQELADSKAIALTVEGQSVPIMGDPALLEEMLRNLMENGIKYNHEHGIVRAIVGQKDGACTVAIEDCGIGIPVEHQARVFERFYRVDSSRSKATGGTGLGLSIVKHGAEYHQAGIALASKPGVGTTVTLSFPGVE